MVGNDYKPEFIMMVGIPASGKSSNASVLSFNYDAIVHSSDELRKEMFLKTGQVASNDKVFGELHRRIKQDLSKGKSVIYDACNISFKRRMAFLQEIKKYSCRKICYIMVRDYMKCVEADSQRNSDTRVTDVVIKKMLLSFWVPQYYEGWDDIRIIFVGGLNEVDAIQRRLDFYDEYNQGSKYHSFKLGEHMSRTANYLRNKNTVGDKSTLITAARWHDVGKPLARTYDGNTGIHYFKHNNSGAYEFLNIGFAINLPIEKLVAVCNFIQWHMHPYNLKNNGGTAKFIKLVGLDFYTDLMLLHEADLNSHK